MSQFSLGTHNQPEITTLFGPPKTSAGIDAPRPDARFAITRKSLGKTLVVLALFPFLWGVYVGAYRYFHPAPTLWTRTDATALDGKIQLTRDACTAGWHQGRSTNASVECDYYIFRFVVSYFVAGASRQSKIDSPLFEHKRDAETFALQFAPGRQLAIIYDPLEAGRVRRADDPPPSQYAVGPSIGYYPLIGGPKVVIESATGPLKVAFCFLIPGIFLLLSSRAERNPRTISAP